MIVILGTSLTVRAFIFYLFIYSMNIGVKHSAVSRSQLEWVIYSRITFEKCKVPPYLIFMTITYHKDDTHFIYFLYLNKQNNAFIRKHFIPVNGNHFWLTENNCSSYVDTLKSNIFVIWCYLPIYLCKQNCVI